MVLSVCVDYRDVLQVAADEHAKKYMYTVVIFITVSLCCRG